MIKASLARTLTVCLLSEAGDRPTIYVAVEPLRTHAMRSITSTTLLRPNRSRAEPPTVTVPC